MDKTIALLEHYKYLILLPLAVAEGPILTVIAGLLCSTGFLSLRLTVPVLLLGDAIGDTIYYSLGYWGHRFIPAKLSRRMRVNSEKLNRLRASLKANFFRSVLLSKMVLGVGFAGILLIGRLKIRYLKFIKTCFLVSIIQATLYLTTGWLFGSFYQQINRVLGYGAALAIAGLLAFLLIVFTKSKIKQYENSIRGE